VRIAIPAIAAALLLVPVAPASVAAAGFHQANATDFSAAKRKKARMSKKAKAPKVEYMRAAPSK
jgi:hypothetical protein